MEDPLETVTKTTHCRFCGERKFYAEVLDLAGDLKTLNEYLEIIKYLNIDYLDLSHMNQLPKSTCETCYDQFQEAYSFFQKINEVQYSLTELICKEKNGAKDKKVEFKEGSGVNSNNDDLYQQSKECKQLNTKPETSSEQSVNNNDLMEFCFFCTERKTSKALINLSEEMLTEEYTKIIDFFKINHLKNTIEQTKIACQACYQTLQNAYNFFTNVKRNQTLLKEIYSIETESNTLKIKMEDVSNICEIQESPNKETNPLSLCAITIQEDNSWTNYTYICCHCKIMYDNMEELRAHSKEKHRICYALRCADCDEQFNSYNEFVEHVRQHRDILRLYCQYCNMKFDTAALCMEHVDSHYIGTQKICGMCGEVLPYENTLEWHRKLYGSASVERRAKYERSWEDYEWICQECGSIAPDVGSLRIHTQTAHGKCFAMRCADCSKPTKSYKLFVAHVLSHRPYLKNFCQYCNVLCDDTKDLNQHIIQHITSQQRPCNGCGQIFKDNLHLAKHKQTFNSSKPKDPLRQERARDAAKRNRRTRKNDEVMTTTVPKKRRRTKKIFSPKELTCPQCLKLFDTITKLKRHVKTHLGDTRRRNYVCSTCGRSFLTGNTMKEHKKVHDPKMHVCQVCKKEFHTTTALKNHIITHTEERPFVCDECGNSFKTKRRLKCHLISHSNVKRFKCMYCYKEFNFKMNLKTHEYQHTGLRPYSCEMCDKTFTNWTNCNKHMMRKHGITLAKTKITAQGRVDINRKTGELKKLKSDAKTKVWLTEMMKPGKPGKKTVNYE